MQGRIRTIEQYVTVIVPLFYEIIIKSFMFIMSNAKLTYEPQCSLIGNTMISKLQSTQNWLSQFLPEHRDVAAQLLDCLHIVKTEEMIDDIKAQIGTLLLDSTDKCALLPIREVSRDEVIYINEMQPPRLQSCDEPLGSEAFISNLYTQLNRSEGVRFPLERRGNTAPSIKYMKQNSFRHLFLIDDLIGSGKRVTDYLNALFRNRTINSWVSYGYIKIHIIGFMATKSGKAVVEKHIRRRKNVNLYTIHRTPLIADLPNNLTIRDLCIAYADTSETIPLGFKSTAVRVVFTHSAPNNLPAILYRQKYANYTPNGVNLNITRWNALFPKRSITPEFTSDLLKLEDRPSVKVGIIKILNLISGGAVKEPNITTLMGSSMASTQRYIRLCLKLDLISITEGVFSLTPRGESELRVQDSTFQSIDKPTGFYYPKA
ncbi:hypothetical protein ACKGLS_003451 [Vibrio alginolyticus]|uniref:phosphoribosyltransferase-like protein n=2 Tax=Vibrio harveyi group TaxID=717610 RepID=UPI001B831095|nr:hypothetical protein [Vibrio alginolyticus]MDF5024906.1 hypothetical protein [Vibrio parahaemolyticus]HBC3532277.1 hypothetical protein [Vibrio vulnificus]MBS9955488.1 hypothetical protein [Vibrio alginolyticus]MCG9741281.1 hypothetical protein [Vibrio alginolyticus]MDF5059066.1 hypothetical protein [Vibrio parahaemolyticus]